MSEICECISYTSADKAFLEGRQKHHKRCPHLIEAYRCTLDIGKCIVSEKDLNNLDRQFAKDFHLKVGKKVRITQKEYDELELE
jgi:hypothetical protein